MAQAQALDMSERQESALGSRDASLMQQLPIDNWPIVTPIVIGTDVGGIQ